MPKPGKRAIWIFSCVFVVLLTYLGLRNYFVDAAEGYRAEAPPSSAGKVSPGIAPENSLPEAEIEETVPVGEPVESDSVGGFIASEDAAGPAGDAGDPLTAVEDDDVTFEGIIEPHVVVDLGSPAEGIISKVLVDRTSLVQKGQTLIELDSSVEWAALNKARAMADFNGEIALQEEQLKFARRIHDRVRKLHSVSDQDKDQAATDVILTEKRLKKARENQELAILEMKRAQALYSRHTIKSPISGVVVERYVTPGEHVNNQPLLRLAEINPLRVEVIVPSYLFGRIVPGMEATVVPELKKYGEQTATVTLADRVIDSASNTFGVRLNLPNLENRIPSGLRCTVRFHFDEAAEAVN